MMYGLQAYMLPMDLLPSAQPYSLPDSTATTQSPTPDTQAVAMIIDGADDRSVAAAARLVQDGIEVRVGRKSFELEKQAFARGSLVVTQLDQRGRRPDWRQSVSRCAEALGLSASSVTTGFGPGDLPDLGGEHFVRLEPPRVAMLMRGAIDSQDFGTIWHLLDHRLHLPHSQLNMDLSAVGADLSRYNVLILPNRWSGGRAAELMPSIESWVRSGGTLIAIGSATNLLTDNQSKLSEVRRLENVLDQLDEYELAVWREWMATQQILPEVSNIWSNRVPAGATFPWTTYGGPRPAAEERKRQDAWQRLFPPAGALLCGRVDQEHWLTFGCQAPLPLMIRQAPVLMSKPSTETAVRLGFFAPSETSPQPTGVADTAGASKETVASKEMPRTGWAMMPPGNDLYLRMSGLLWPEAAQRLAHAAYVTREPVGDGQVILFADSPNFRASTLGSARLLMNALVYGPGFGARQPIRP